MENRRRSSNKYLISFLNKKIDNERKILVGEITPKIFPN